MRFPAVLLALAALLSAAPALAQAPAAVTPAPSPQAQSGVRTAAPPRPLTGEDAKAWLDGMMPYALERGDIAGAVVVIVKDGHVVLAQGYGFSDVKARRRVDAERTLFRPGSVSKVFTWTAVMQLVEAGKLDLDRDINSYLDFRIPARPDGPITLRHLMTHTPGFEEAIKGVIHSDPKRAEALGQTLKRWVPTRVYRAGSTPAYSNYGTALAGYIVERVSGMPFDDYVEARIFRPLGMTRSSFRQPLPAPFAADMSKGYGAASGPPQPFEFVSLAPAGSLSATGSDMARFMIAHLQGGAYGPAQLLRPETVRQMHRTYAPGVGPLHRMALGFYEADINGRRVSSHSGDTQWFHSDLHLFLDDGVGLFIALNSGGKDGAAYPLRAAVFEQFADRYLPGPRHGGTLAVDADTARRHAELVSGLYDNSRRSHTNFLAALNLVSQVKVSADADGVLTVKGLDGVSGEPLRWREYAPYVWRDESGRYRFAAEVRDGRVVRASADQFSPVMVFAPTPWWRASSWLVPALAAAVGVLALTVVLWPTIALVRRRYGGVFALTGADAHAHRLARMGAAAVLAVLGGWLALILSLSSNYNLMSSALDPVIWTLNLLGLAVFVGALALALWNAWRVWRAPRGWLARLWSLALVASCALVLWAAFAFRLIAFTADY